ncbi:MAG TPA: hypothetical protein G4O04_05720 [Anaerolineae bacterium]|nr:hypothetical protein [Anaerolineae bacterium]HID84979.1 hypothetical protein [Anaerolineales bacterium]HIQ09409.1 hypothetical protein [Anaerolineaceae bacterium]
MTSSSYEACWAQALVETLGEEAAQRFWSSLAPVEPHAIAVTLGQALERHFGRHAGLGVAVRVGQALFRHLPALHPRAADLPWRMLPVRQRVLQGLTWLLREITPALGLEARVDASGAGWSVEARWRVSGTPSATAPRCRLWQGFFQEALYWLTGRVYPVFLQTTQAEGEERCTFFVPAQPLY